MRNIIAGVLTATLITAALSAGAATAQTGGKQRFTLHFLTVNGMERPSRVTAVGPISGHGTETQEEQAGGVYQAIFHLKRGAVRVRFVEGRPTMHIDPTTCTGTADSKGTFKITGGAKTYTNARGHGTFVDHATLTGSRDTTGRCLGPESGAPIKKRVDTLKMAGIARL